MSATSDWNQFFHQLSLLIASCERQCGVANEQYAEYVLDRLSLAYQVLQSIMNTFQSPAGRAMLELQNFGRHLSTLVQSVREIISLWRRYYETIEMSGFRSHYVTPTHQMNHFGRPRFEITKQQLLHYVHSLSLGRV